MKATELIKNVTELGFTREYALKGIDASLDEIYGVEYREEIGLENEVIGEKLANDILLAFQIEKEEEEMQRADRETEYQRIAA